ncbi:hypothetical protein COLO4_10411 [Corchorus olitorius]|uniref:Uncharacterized protein n=1 Tax=Corchorus olitorius TaxID=93759 RepID=A0A1R3K8N7_9ROSI|nr:hypothetical protein COLO4_10411 [Corchorus olitorius]
MTEKVASFIFPTSQKIQIQREDDPSSGTDSLVGNMELTLNSQGVNELSAGKSFDSRRVLENSSGLDDDRLQVVDDIIVEESLCATMNVGDSLNKELGGFDRQLDAVDKGDLIEFDCWMRCYEFVSWVESQMRCFGDLENGRFIVCN